MRNLLSFLFILAVFLVGFALAGLLFVPPYWWLISLSLRGALVVGFGIIVWKSFHRIPRGRRIAAYFLGTSFEVQYLNDDDERIMTEWYVDNKVAEGDPDWLLFKQYCRRSFLEAFGFGNVVYLQYPFFTRREVVSDRLRVPITAIGSVWTMEEKDFPSVQQVVDVELGLRIGPDFGKLQAAFTGVEFDTPQKAQEGLQSMLEPVVKDAVRRVGRKFVWVPPGSGLTSTRDIRTNGPQFEIELREELRRDLESVFVQSGLMTHLSSGGLGKNGGPGAIGLDIAIEDARPANKLLEAAADEASIAASQAAAKLRQKEGLAISLKLMAEVLGVEPAQALAHDAVTNTEATLLLGGRDVLGAMAGLTGVPKKPKRPPI